MTTIFIWIAVVAVILAVVWFGIIQPLSKWMLNEMLNDMDLFNKTETTEPEDTNKNEEE